MADGEKAMSLADSFEAEAKKGEKPRPDITMPGDFPAPHKDRYVGLGRDLFSRPNSLKKSRKFSGL